MGHRAGWLALGAGIAGGADVILIPEIPYDIKHVAESIRERSRSGKSFSIVSVAEGAMSKIQTKQITELTKKLEESSDKNEKKQIRKLMDDVENFRATHSIRLADKIQELTGIESRVTILGHLQRGGIPSSFDRILATKLGTACADYIHQRKFGIMVASRADGVLAVPLEEVAGKLKSVPLNHSWIESARRVGTCLGD
jgi:6-phosphofructokinase 1